MTRFQLFSLFRAIAPAASLRRRCVAGTAVLFCALGVSSAAGAHSAADSTDAGSGQQAVPDATNTEESVQAPEAAGIAQVRAKLEQKMPSLPIEELASTPVPGIFELISDGQVYYVGENGRYLFDGSLIDLERRENLTEARQAGIQMSLLADMDDADMLIFTPEPGEAEGDSGEQSKPGTTRTLTVFTDTSCPYCSRLHEGMDELLEAGIRVRYLLYPRAGIGSDAHKQLESVWCADDPQAAMTTAKQGGDIPEKTCDNPIDKHIALANKVGLRGTPMIFLDSGEVIPGYQPAAALIKMINESKPL